MRPRSWRSSSRRAAARRGSCRRRTGACPSPSTRGKTHRWYSSTRPWRISVWARFPLPCTCSSGPSSLLERRDALGRVPLDQDRRAPVQRGTAPRRDVLRGVVQRLAAGLLRGGRPVRAEDLVGPASEQHVERVVELLGLDLAHQVVPVVHRPAAVREAAAVVLLGSARGLHDPVEGQEGGHDQLPHRSSPPGRIEGLRRASRASASAPCSAGRPASSALAMRSRSSTQNSVPRRFDEAHANIAGWRGSVAQ